MALEKDGTAYAEVRDRIRSFDLLAFRGGDFVSGTIALLQRIAGGTGAERFTHVGVALRADALALVSPEALGLDCAPGELRALLGDRVFVWESTQSGPVGDGAERLGGGSHLGVQLRDLDEVARRYDENPRTALAWCPMKTELRPLVTPVTQQIVADLFLRYNNTIYDANCLSLVAALFSCLRPCRDACLAGCCRPAREWQFCSELAANVYIELGVLDRDTQAQDVVPMDYFADTQGESLDTDGEIPVLFEPFVRYTAYPRKSAPDSDLVEV